MNEIIEDEVFIILSYCDNEEKIEVLKKTIDKLVLNNKNIILYSKYPIQDDIIKKCTFYIYENYNPILFHKFYCFWDIINNKKIQNVLNYDWGYAVFDQIKKSLIIANSLDYKNAYIINYDVNSDDIENFYTSTKKHLCNWDAVFYKHLSENSIVLTAMALKIESCVSELKKVLNINDYINYDVSLLAEMVFDGVLKKTDINYTVITEDTQPRTSISQSVNTFGYFNTNNIKTLKYFKRCFIGMDTTINTIKIYIDNLFTKVFNINFDFGNGVIKYENLSNDNTNYIEIILEGICPNKLKIISINDEIINETLYYKLDENYYMCNTINNI